MELPEYTEKTGHQTRTTRTYIPYISEISIDMNRECARFARSIIDLGNASRERIVITELNLTMLYASYGVADNFELTRG